MANDATTSRLLLPLVASGTVATANSVQTLWPNREQAVI